MAGRLPIKVATWDYDRVRPLIDGRVTIEGCEPTFVVLPPEECFHRAYVLREFEVSEIGFGPYLIAFALGQAPYVALPVFLSRMFRHSAIYIRTDRGIERPEDLRGRVVGTVEYQMSAVMWCRAFLKEDYGVDPEDMIWRQGGVNVYGRKEKFPLNLPADFPLSPVPPGATLSRMLAEGELDAVFSPEPPDCFGDPGVPVGRLFPDFGAAERDYYRRTGIFPIMHALGIRNDVAEAEPWLARNVYEAFLEAKRLADRELFELRALKIGLPWLVPHAMETRALMGDDFWPYGIAENRTTLDAMTRYSHEQGLCARKLEVEEVFQPMPGA